MVQKPVLEIDLAKTLAGLDFTMDQFIDLCILCGCDYTGTLKGIGPKTAHAMIQKYKTLEKALASLDADKKPKPGEFLYNEAAELFRHPDVLDIEEAKKAMAPPDMQIDELKKFLIEEKGFGGERVCVSCVVCRVSSPAVCSVCVDFRCGRVVCCLVIG